MSRSKKDGRKGGGHTQKGLREARGIRGYDDAGPANHRNKQARSQVERTHAAQAFYNSLMDELFEDEG